MIVGVLQARLSSSRLPGKVLADLEGAPMIVQQLRRLKRSSRLEAIVVATSTSPEDRQIAEAVQTEAISAYRGSLDNVLDRVVEAADGFDPSHVVRLTADCPLADWEVIDQAVDTCLEGDYDYASNTLTPTWPDGLDVEVIRYEALQSAAEEAKSAFEREHVTPFIYARPERFSLKSVERTPDISGMRWTVDEPADLDFVRAVYAELFPQKENFLTEDILNLLDKRPELLELNTGIARNEGLKLSQAKEDPGYGTAGV